MSKRLYSDIVKIGYESTDSSEDEIGCRAQVPKFNIGATIFSKKIH